MNIGERIKNLRKEKGLTQTELALKIGYKDKTALSKVERGLNNPYQSKIVALAEALDTTPAYLMGYEDMFVPSEDNAETHAWLISSYEQLSEDDKKTVISLINRLLIK